MPLTDRLEVLPVVMERLVWLRERLISVSVTVQLAVLGVFPPLTVAVIMAVVFTGVLPAARTVTVVPVPSTVTYELLLDHVTVWLGFVVAVMVPEPPAAMLMLGLFRVIPGLEASASTVTMQDLTWLPSSVVTVISAVPADTPVTTPLSSTVAT